MYLYFIKVEGFDLVKIGYAADPEKRLRMLQTGCPFVLYVILQLRCLDAPYTARDVEKRMHSKFEHLQLRGEWFMLTEELEAWIEATGNGDHERADRIGAVIEWQYHRPFRGGVKIR